MAIRVYVVTRKNRERLADLLTVVRSREPAWIFSQMVLRDLERTGMFVLAYDEKVPVGYLSFSLKPSKVGKLRLEGNGIYVIPSHRGKKVTPFLTRFVRRYAERKGITLVHSPRANHPATRVLVDAAREFRPTQRQRIGVRVRTFPKGDLLNHVVTHLPLRKRKSR